MPRKLPLFAAVFTAAAVLLLEHHAMSSITLETTERMSRFDLPSCTGTESSSLSSEGEKVNEIPDTIDVTAAATDTAETATPELCAEKEWALNIIRSSDSSIKVTNQLCKSLPTEEAVTAIYGKGPVVYGLETCEQFRQNVAQVMAEKGASATATVAARVAGLYNTGTNAMAISIGQNMEGASIGTAELQSKEVGDILSKYEVPWKKHVPPQFRFNTTLPADAETDLRTVLPVVLVRDPYWWIQSMCKSPYGVKGIRKKPCPGIFAHAKAKRQIDKVSIRWGQQFPMEYTTIVAMWNEWIREYYDADFPRLIVRFEDQIFHAEEVMSMIRQCVGRTEESSFRQFTKRSKFHSRSKASGFDFVATMQKYSSSKGRIPADGGTVVKKGRGKMTIPQNMKAHWDYVEKHLDPELMRAFGYKHHP